MEGLYKNKYRVKSIRLSTWDYSEDGYYFVTICVKDSKCLLSKVENDKLILNRLGEIVRDGWEDLPKHYPNIILDEFIVMPNHIHGIIVINNYNSINVETGLKPTNVETGLKPVSTENEKNINHNNAETVKNKKYPLSEIIRAFKTFSARRINLLKNTPGQSFWQKNYYEHIIRHQEELNHIREYIIDNSRKWAEDKNNPKKIKW